MKPLFLAREEGSLSATAHRSKVGEASVDVAQRRISQRRVAPLTRSVPLLVIDARPFTRQLLVHLIETTTHEYEICAIAGVHELPVDDPDRTGEIGLIILNIGSGRVGEQGVTEQIACINQAFPEVPLILLSQWEHVGDFAEALRQGVRGYLTTSLDPRVAVEVLRLVRAGGTFVPAIGLADAFPPQQPAPSAKSEELAASAPRVFTPRQCQVLQLLQQGKPNKIIAHELDMTESTVKIHVRHIMKKLGATNRTQAALLARRMFDGKDQD